MSKKDKAPKPEAEAVDGAQGEAAAKKKPPLMILIAGGVGALVVLGGGGAGAMMLMGKKPPEAGGEKAHAKPKKKHEAEKGKDGKSPITEGPDGAIFYTMPGMLTDLQTSGPQPSHLKLTVAFELPNAEAADDIELNQPRLNDMFQTFLRELRPEDLSGSAGSYQLRMEIQRRVNLVIAPAKVNSVLIQEMLIN